MCAQESGDQSFENEEITVTSLINIQYPCLINI